MQSEFKVQSNPLTSQGNLKLHKLMKSLGYNHNDNYAEVYTDIITFDKPLDEESIVYHQKLNSDEHSY